MQLDTHKQKIRQCFNRVAATYDTHNVMQQQAGEKLIAMLGKHNLQPQKIIDLGCGTGSVTEQLAQNFQYQLFHALDISEQLLLKARERLGAYDMHVYEGDFDYLNDKDILFDLAFSNMSLQWSCYLDNTLAVTQKNLAADGVLAFSLPLVGTFAELTQCAKNTFYAPTAVNDLLHKNQFEVLEHHEEAFSFSFDSLYKALKALKAVGANYVFSKPFKSLRGKSFLHDLTNPEPADIQNFTFTYVIGFFIARKLS